MKENEKLAVKLKKKEILRITDMAAKAMKLDPRLVAHKQNQKAAKEAEKKAKEDAAANMIANEAKKAEEAKELAAVSKAEKEKARKKASAARNSFRKLLRSIAVANKEEGGEFGSISTEDIELTLSTLSTDDVLVLVDAMGGEAAIKTSGLLCVAGAAVVRESVRLVQEKNTSGK